MWNRGSVLLEGKKLRWVIFFGRCLLIFMGEGVELLGDCWIFMVVYILYFKEYEV